MSVEQLRFTPAGIPILACVLEHHSQVSEADGERQLEFSLQALAAGSCSRLLEQVSLGSSAWFSGFLAPRRRHSKTLVFHIIDFKVLVRA